VEPRTQDDKAKSGPEDVEGEKALCVCGHGIDKRALPVSTDAVGLDTGHLRQEGSRALVNCAPPELFSSRLLTPNHLGTRPSLPSFPATRMSENGEMERPVVAVDQGPKIQVP
jgi:hypothetical protein